MRVPQSAHMALRLPELAVSGRYSAVLAAESFGARQRKQ